MLKNVSALMRIVLIAFFLLVAAFSAVIFLQTSRAQLVARHDLALETPTIETIRLLRDGKNIYSSEIYASPPFNMTIYTPTYFRFLSMWAEDPENPFRVARVVSGCFMLASATLFLFAASDMTSLFVALVGFVFFLSQAPVMTNTFFSRHDPMALFFALASVLTLARWRSTWAVMASASLAWLAFFTKQSEVAPIVAGFLFLLWAGDRRRAGLFFAYVSSLLLGSLALGRWLWGAGFFFSVIGTGPMNYSFATEWRVWAQVFTQWSAVVFAFILLAGGFAFVRLHLKKPRDRSSTSDLFFIYAFVSLLCLIAFLPRHGSGTNYFFEIFSAGILFLISLGSSGRVLKFSWPATVAFLFLFTAMLVDDFRLNPRFFSFTDEVQNAQAAVNRTHLLAELEQAKTMSGLRAPNSQVSVLFFPFTESLALELGFPPLISDDFLYEDLWREHFLPLDTFFAPIRSQRYDLILIPHGLPAPWSLGWAEFDSAFFSTVSMTYVKVFSGRYDYYARTQERP